MRVTRATIDGFGKLYDVEIDFTTEHFICIYGENESGKSTLNAFILFMFFGMPPKQRSFYQPKTGAKMGGRLTVFDEEIGEFTVERYNDLQNGAAVCYSTDGQQYDEKWLKSRLHGMTYKTYQSIFSFSAMDLADLKGVGEKELSDVLLSVGLTGSKNIYAIEKRLETQLQTLFKPYGKKPAINAQLATLDELFIALSASKKEEARYQEKKDEVQILTTEIQALRDQLQSEKQLLSMIEKKQQALPLIHQYHHFTQELTELPDTITFPEDGLSRLNTLKEHVLPIKSELSVLTANYKKYMEEQYTLQENRVDADIIEQAKMLLGNAEQYKENEKELGKLQEMLDKATLQMDISLTELNIGLTTDDLASIVLPIHLENTWNQLKNDQDQLNLENEQLRQERFTALKQKDRLEINHKEISRQLLSEERIDELTKITQEYKQEAYIKAVMENKQKQEIVWRQNKKQKEKSSFLILAGCLILACLTGGIALFIDYNGLFNLVALFVIAGVGQWLLGKSSLKEMERLVAIKPTTNILTNETEATHGEAEELLAKQNRHENELTAILEQLNTNEIQLMQITERMNMLDRNERQLDQQIEEQCKNYSFLRKIDIAYWTAYFHSVKSLLKQYAEIVELSKQCRDLSDKQMIFQAKLNRFISEKNWETSKGTVFEQIANLENLINQHQRENELFKQYAAWIIENNDQQGALKQKLQIYEKEINSLYSTAVVHSEEEFFQKASIWEEKRKVNEKLAGITEQLLMHFTNEEWMEIRHEVLDDHMLEIRQEGLAETIKTLEADLELKRQQLADVNANLTRMEASVTYSNIFHRFNMEQERLEELAKEWAVLRTAKELLLETKRNYRDKYLAQVMEKTSEYFRRLTNNAYEQVFAPEDGQLFRVSAANNSHFTVNELSRGTTDQLYIALRISISEVMSEKHSLPFIIDDAFVHFDLSRLEEMMNILAEIATKQQVIVFTCKNDVINSAETVKIVHLKNSVRIN